MDAGMIINLQRPTKGICGYDAARFPYHPLNDPLRPSVRALEHVSLPKNKPWRPIVRAFSVEYLKK
jgi:hypothetical protein